MIKSRNICNANETIMQDMKPINVIDCPCKSENGKRFVQQDTMKKAELQKIVSVRQEKRKFKCAEKK